MQIPNQIEFLHSLAFNRLCTSKVLLQIKTNLSLQPTLEMNTQ